MKTAVGWQVLLYALLASMLSACGASRAGPSPTAAMPYAAVPGIEELGPIPRYSLDLLLLPADARLKGRALVTIPNRAGIQLNEIVFRLYPNLPQYGGQMSIGPVWVDGQRGTSTLRAEDTALVVPLPRPLAPDSQVTISMTFGVDIPQRDSGYVLFGHSQGIWSLPDAYPLLAVHDGEKWHEDLAPAYADATFSTPSAYEVTLTLPPTLTLAATGSIISQTTSEQGQRVYKIAGGALREFAWLASADYEEVETLASGTRVHSLYLRGDEAAGQLALNTAAAALRAYGETFGPYPLPEMTVAEAPLQYFGMEYPSLNLIGIDLYRDRRSQLEIRVAHEIAHQWWYSQVGNDQINTPWLDEGLAEYSTFIYYSQVYGEAKANTLLNQRWLAPYQSAVDNGLDAVVNQPSAAFGEGMYEVMVYAKAALFFDALRQDVGDEVFYRILKAYASRYRWRIATPEDFLQVAEETSGKSLRTIYDRWILSRR